MPATVQNLSPRPVPPSIPPGSFCAIEDRPDGLVIHFRLDKNEAERLRRKAGTQGQDNSKLAVWAWQEFIRPALQSTIY